MVRVSKKLKELAAQDGYETAQLTLAAKPGACYDCGSTIAGHHTPLCEFAPKGSKRDLPAMPGTQWWTGMPPKKTRRGK